MKFAEIAYLSNHDVDVPVQNRERVTGHVIIDGLGLKMINPNEFPEAQELESSDLKDQDVKSFRRLYPTYQGKHVCITTDPSNRRQMMFTVRTEAEQKMNR
ncbi:hypothetical protein EPUS_07841 [Endocarpon pusillum Z07020]|uniref:Uncharacterized protein n=1 Tax=Endocarpon pusillum (strain Z07020 / HMAS-L-300199) TaxID=1263415 RepID=U1FX40_ENDPU|nr:uncharacterized protein EPUS_07841 [Endocarpon pusillum Z07020]ERF69437.1 hypothetical protein EPUS_07841 [Endocarpon pusillum Z07020]